MPCSEGFRRLRETVSAQGDTAAMLDKAVDRILHLQVRNCSCADGLMILDHNVFLDEVVLNLPLWVSLHFASLQRQAKEIETEVLLHRATCPLFHNDPGQHQHAGPLK